jgi:hypothetical protein
VKAEGRLNSRKIITAVIETDIASAAGIAAITPYSPHSLPKISMHGTSRMI